jgi:hypothetical protein
MKTTSKQLIESSHLYLDLSKGLLEKIDIYFSNTNLDKNSQIKLIKIFEEIYSQGYENCVID